MRVEYNDVMLEMVEIQSIKRTGVWDDSHTDLLYIRWEIGLIAQYSAGGYPVGTSVKTLRRTLNPAASLRLRLVDALKRVFTNPLRTFRDVLFGRDAIPSPVDMRHDTRAEATGVTVVADDIIFGPRVEPTTPGFGPIATDVTLRNRLMSPRKKLRISGFEAERVSGTTQPGQEIDLLVSPVTPYVTDPTNGPHPIALDILDGMDASFAVFYQIETSTLPCDDDSDRLVLSHRWQQSHTHDESMYLTQVTEGEIVFNGAMVNTLKLNVDLLRFQFFQAIPLGCYRVIDHITPSTDGLTYTYQYSDHDQTIIFDAGDSGASHIDIAEKLSYYQPWKVGDVFALPTLDKVIEKLKKLSPF